MTDTKQNFNIGTVNAWFPVYVNLNILRDAKRRNRQRRLEKVKANWKLAASAYKICGRGFVKRGKALSRKYYGRDLKYMFEVFNKVMFPVYQFDDCVGLVCRLECGAQGGDADG